MIWDALVGQQPAKDYLRAVLTARRQAHGFLFKGPVGVGKRTAAWLFAQILLCHNPPKPDEACGECKSCHWFANRRGAAIDHPDVISLLKFTGSGENRTEKPVGDHDPIIPLESVQYICEQLHRSPMAGERRVVIISEAQRLCRGQAEPANAFLKTLEEPPESSLIILTSSQPEALLETIISRVQGVQFRRLSSNDVRTGLERTLKSKPPAERELAAHLSDGSLGRAIELLEGDLKTWRQAVVNALDKFNPRTGPQFGLMLWALAEAEGKRLFESEKVSQKAAQNDEVEEDDEQQGENEGAAKTEKGWQRYVFRRLLEVLEVCFRDAAVCASGGETPVPASLLLQPDQQKLAQSLGQKFGVEGCQRMLAAISEALLAVRLYVRGDVVGRALAGKMAEGIMQHS